MGTDLGDLVFESPPWLKAEAEASDVVLSSRVRLARNIGNIPFPNHAKDETLEDVLIQVERVLPEVEAFSGAVFFEMATLSNTEQHILAERRLISPEFIMKAIPAGLVLGDDGLSSLMVNEEDHLRLQVLHPGLGLDQTLEKAEELDTRLVMRSIKNTHRVLNNKAAQMTYELEQKGASLEEMMGIITGQNTLNMIENGNVDSGILPCGQDIGLVTEIKPVKEVVEDIMRQAIDVQRRMDSFF